MAKGTNVVLENGIAKFNMGVKTDSVKGREYVVGVEASFQGANVEELAAFAFSGSSIRVRLQSRLRAQGEKRLEELEVNGLHLSWDGLKELLATNNKVVDVVKAISSKGREEYIADVMKLGATREMAEQMADKMGK